MKPIALFDILDALEGTKYEIGELKIWNPYDTSYADRKFHDQMGQVGFDSLNSLENLGSISFFLFLWIAKALIALITLLMMTCPCANSRKPEWLREIA
jgi:hypothetical protein